MANQYRQFHTAHLLFEFSQSRSEIYNKNFFLKASTNPKSEPQPYIRSFCFKFYGKSLWKVIEDNLLEWKQYQWRKDHW